MEEQECFEKADEQYGICDLRTERNRDLTKMLRFFSQKVLAEMYIWRRVDRSWVWSRRRK